MLRFLADESCDFLVVRTLRSSGHEVVAIAELDRQAVDPEVLARAVEERLVLLTEDKDFGRLVFSAGQGANGVILIRYPAHARAGLAAVVLNACERLGDTLYSSFVVLEPGRIRLTRLPGSFGGEGESESRG